MLQILLSNRTNLIRWLILYALVMLILYQQISSHPFSILLPLYRIESYHNMPLLIIIICKELIFITMDFSPSHKLILFPCSFLRNMESTFCIIIKRPYSRHASISKIQNFTILLIFRSINAKNTVHSFFSSFLSWFTQSHS